MDKFDRIQKLHRLLLSHQYPISMSQLEIAFECSPKTIKRTIETMQLHLHAPLKYCTQQKGWYYDKKDNEKIELPGLWLTANELQSLSALLAILQNIDKGFLSREVGIIEKQISKLLAERNITLSEFTQRIKFLPMQKHLIQSNVFSLACDGLLQRKQIDITYKDTTGKLTNRTVSPQTLAYYRENWYLDSWCHLRQALRTFSIARITKINSTQLQAKNISNQQLKDHFTSSYGIFAGKATRTAKLKFYPEVATHIAEQQWHPEQSSKWENGNYILSFPYGDDRELILEILKHSNSVEVLAPASLKNSIISRLKGALQIYQ